MTVADLSKTYSLSGDGHDRRYSLHAASGGELNPKRLTTRGAKDTEARVSYPLCSVCSFAANFRALSRRALEALVDGEAEAVGGELRRVEFAYARIVVE